MKNIHRVNGFIYIYGDNDKVILSNDPELATFGVQELPQDVIQYLTDNPSCEWVEVVKILQKRWGTYFYNLPNQTVGKEIDGIYRYNYKIILPQDQPNQELDCPYEFTSRCTMGRCDCKPKKVLGIEFTINDDKMCTKTPIKQETLEEVAERIAENFKNVDFKAGVIYGIIEGAKWQQEQDKNKYSEEEVTDLLQKALIHKDDGEIGALVTAQGEIRTANFNQWVDKYKKK